MEFIQKFRNERGKRKRPPHLVSAALSEFTRLLTEELDGVCPNCERKIDYERIGRESLAKHCDGICAGKRQGAAQKEGATTAFDNDNRVLNDVQLPGGCETKELPNGADRNSIDDLSGNEGSTGEDGVPADETELEWEQLFRDNDRTAVQVGGARMTGLQIRFNLPKNINRTTILAILTNNPELWHR